MKNKIKRSPKKPPKTMDETKALAIAFAQQWAESELSEFVEPVRAGTPKGEPIGFSKNKKRAALFMVLYPNGLDIEGIAKTSGTKLGVLQVWRTQEIFKKEIDWAIASLAQYFWNIVEPIFEEIEKDGAHWRGEAYKAATFYLRMLPFFNWKIFSILAHKAAVKLYQGKLTYTAFAPGQSIHQIFQKPDWPILDGRWTILEAGIDQLADPEIWNKNPKELIKTFAATLKKEISDIFYLLQQEVYSGKQKAERREFEAGKADSRPDRGRSNNPRRPGILAQKGGHYRMLKKTGISI